MENFFSNRRLLILAHIVVKTLYLLYYNYKTLTNRNFMLEYISRWRDIYDGCGFLD